MLSTITQSAHESRQTFIYRNKPATILYVKKSQIGIVCDKPFAVEPFYCALLPLQEITYAPIVGGIQQLHQGSGETGLFWSGPLLGPEDTVYPGHHQAHRGKAYLSTSIVLYFNTSALPGSRGKIIE